MKVVCDRAALSEAVNLVAGVVAARSPRPQLTCMKLTAGEGDGAQALRLTGTDGEISLSLATTGVDVQQAGEALVSASKLQQIVQAEDAEPTLTLTGKDDAIEVRGVDARFTVYGYPAADFPPPPEFPAAEDDGGSSGKVRARFLVDGAEFAQLAARTLFSTARETSRYAINGVLLKREGKKLEMVATDGRRLALARGAAESAGSDDAVASCIVPSKGLGLAAKLARGADRVHVAITENQIIFAFGEADDPTRAVLSSVVVEGAFPPYEEVIPKDQDKKATFDAQALASAIRRAALLTNEESRGVRMAFEAKDGGAEGAALKLTSRAAELGEAEVTIDAESYDGEGIEIGFNPAFLVEALKVLSEPRVTIEMKATNKPGLIRSGADFLYVVMPVDLTR